MQLESLSVSVPSISRKDFVLGKSIGQGSYGEVYDANWNGIRVAVKQLYLKHLSADLANEFEQEVRIMAVCHFPHIVRLYGICMEEGAYAMVMEFLSKGSLYDVLHDGKIVFPWNPLRWQVALDMSKGLSYLHGKNIVHRDLKSLNILLDEDFRAKIADFGLSKVKVHSQSTGTKAVSGLGTTRWRAPELFGRGKTANKTTDIYSCGVILWEIASRQIPYSDALDDVMAMSFIKEGEKEKIPSDCPPTYGEIILRCWRDPHERPEATELVEALEGVKPPLIEKANLDGLRKKPWCFDPETPVLDAQENQPYQLLKPTESDVAKVISFYQHHPVNSHGIKNIHVIYNPNMLRKFALYMEELQNRDQNPAFTPTWDLENDTPDEKILRKNTYDYFTKLASPYVDTDCPSVKLLPVWHGTKPEVLDSLFRTGYAALASTDSGFFGKGIYSAHEAEYAHRVYSKGALLVNWVATFSPFPVIHSDMERLKLSENKANYSNYDSHFVPVFPLTQTKNETIYYACQPNQSHRYTEMVVFQSAGCLPLYLVELENLSLLSGTILPTKRYENWEALYQQGHINIMNHDYADAFDCFQRASDVGYPPADLVLGYMYQSGELPPVPIDHVLSAQHYDKAISRMDWFKTQSEEGTAEAQIGLGFCHMHGIGVGKDFKEAFKYYRLASDQGHTIAQRNLGLCYEKGDGVKKDLTQAARFFQLAAQKGDEIALFNLGLCYKKGEGVKKEILKAIACFQPLAEKGHVHAQFFLGLCYDSVGGTENIKKALDLYRLAAAQNHTQAQRRLEISANKKNCVLQ